MKELLAYLNRLTPEARDAYAARCKTSVGYLRKAVSAGQPLRESLCIRLDRESGGEVQCEALRPDVDWAYLQNRSGKRSLNDPQMLQRQAPAAIESGAGEVAHG